MTNYTSQIPSDLGDSSTIPKNVENSHSDEEQFVPQRQLPPPPGSIPYNGYHVPPSQPLPQMHRSTLFPPNTPDFDIISKAFNHANILKDSIFSMNSLCEKLKNESLTKDILLRERDSHILFLTEKCNNLETELNAYREKLKESFQLLDANRREAALLMGSIQDKNTFIENSIQIKQEHDLLLPTDESIDILSAGIKLEEVNNDDDNNNDSETDDSVKIVNGSGSDQFLFDNSNDVITKDTSSNDADMEEGNDDFEELSDNMIEKDLNEIENKNISCSPEQQAKINDDNLRQISAEFDELIELKSLKFQPEQLLAQLRKKFLPKLTKLVVGCPFNSFHRAKFLLFLHYSKSESLTYLIQGDIQNSIDSKTNDIKIINKLNCGHCGQNICELVLDYKIDNLVRLVIFEKDHTCDFKEIVHYFLTDTSQELPIEEKLTSLTNIFIKLDRKINLFQTYLSLISPQYSFLSDTFFEPFVYLGKLLISQVPKSSYYYDYPFIFELTSIFISKKLGLKYNNIQMVNEKLNEKYDYAERFQTISGLINSYGLKNQNIFEDIFRYLKLRSSLGNKNGVTKLLTVLNGLGIIWIAYSLNNTLFVSSSAPIDLEGLSKGGMDDLKSSTDLFYDDKEPVNFTKSTRSNSSETKNIKKNITESNNKSNTFSFDSSIAEIDSEVWKTRDGCKPINEDYEWEFPINIKRWEKFIKNNLVNQFFFQNPLPEKFLTNKCLPYLEVDKISMKDKHLLMVSIRTSSYENIPLCFSLTKTINKEIWLQFLLTFCRSNSGYFKNIEVCHILTSNDPMVKSAAALAFGLRKIVLHVSARHLIKDIKEFTNPSKHGLVDELVHKMFYSSDSKIVDDSRIKILSILRNKSNESDSNYLYSFINNFNENVLLSPNLLNFNVQNLDFTDEYKQLFIKDQSTSNIIFSLLSLQKLKLSVSMKGYIKQSQENSIEFVRLGNILYSASLTLGYLFTVQKDQEGTFSISLKEEFKKKYSFEDFFAIVKNLYCGYELEPNYFKDRRIKYYELYERVASLTQEFTEKDHLKYKCSICNNSLKEVLVSCPHESALLMFKSNISMKDNSIDWDYLLTNMRWYRYKYFDVFYVNPLLFKDYVPANDDETKLLPCPLEMQHLVVSLKLETNTDKLKKRSSTSPPLESKKRKKVD